MKLAVISNLGKAVKKVLMKNEKCIVLYDEYDMEEIIFNEKTMSMMGCTNNWNMNGNEYNVGSCIIPIASSRGR